MAGPKVVGVYELPLEVHFYRPIPSSTKRYLHKKIVCNLLLATLELQSHKNGREKSILHVPLFPIYKSINYNYMNICLEILVLLPGYNYNYMNYSPTNYLRNNFVGHGTL